MAGIQYHIFTPEERELLDGLDPNRIPRHLAIIMDGNGRWATRQGLPRVLGHRAGVEAVRRTIMACVGLGIQHLTLYSFSTENWSRPDDEVQALMGLIEAHMRSEADEFNRQGVHIRHLGRREGLPASLLEAMRDVQDLTQHNSTLTVHFAINYSGRAELTDAARRLAQAARAGEIDPDALAEADLAAALYSPDVPDPDLLMRTAGEQRVSNFLLWQIAYAEIWVTPILWPDVSALQLIEAIRDYQQRQRKFGGVLS